MRDERKDGVTRRAAVVGGLVGAASLAAVVASTSREQPSSEPDERQKTPGGERLPVVFMPHGGGPWPFVDLGFDDKPGFAALTEYLQSVRNLPKTPPKALLVISAHWEESVPTVMTSPRPPMLYDYYGFPPASYQLQWPAPGNPQLAARVRELLGAAGFQTAADSQRGYDHGTFVPLKLTYPEADVPTVQLSLIQGLDPEQHLAMGRALAPLRDEGVFIIGSGMSYHDLRGFFGPNARRVSETFDVWLRETATLEAKDRDARLAEWDRAPSGRQSHPREEHLLPLMVIAGAAGADRGTIPYNGMFMGTRLSAVHFG
ncbi:DODA-type extradiol aromatic ring-opening family dioxygenase [Pyxidicoccus xibeiensis]|uniref:DODA-type extradiol aromatic ring-opening family dioxygenase n=1 Tax=Pyxidicoccus xibeiensis TaxID=2906759 RepID=UPI0020A797AF|nr:class III extradiol ring-cleavage dioxygenase [Pyxidicoccus xibeiensis]MCP3144909.1 dioxygenase [Pyxidicoccus xibeiensis]